MKKAQRRGHGSMPPSCSHCYIVAALGRFWQKGQNTLRLNPLEGRGEPRGVTLHDSKLNSISVFPDAVRGSASFFVFCFPSLACQFLPQLCSAGERKEKEKTKGPLQASSEGLDQSQIAASPQLFLLLFKEEATNLVSNETEQWRKSQECNCLMTPRLQSLRQDTQAAKGGKKEKKAFCGISQRIH